MDALRSLEPQIYRQVEVKCSRRAELMDAALSCFNLNFKESPPSTQQAAPVCEKMYEPV